MMHHELYKLFQPQASDQATGEIRAIQAYSGGKRPSQDTQDRLLGGSPYANTSLRLHSHPTLIGGRTHHVEVLSVHSLP